MDAILVHEVQFQSQYKKGKVMSVREKAEAHLRNVQQQIAELQNQKGLIDADIAKLKEYLQQGVAELETGKTEPSLGVPKPPVQTSPTMLNLGE